jgi:hypothetical protein
MLVSDSCDTLLYSNNFSLVPLVDLNLFNTLPLQHLVELQQKLVQSGPPYQGPKKTLSQWKLLGADATLLKVIAQGIKLPMNQVPPPNSQCPPLDPVLFSSIQKYLQLGVVRELTAQEVQKTKCWVRTFGRPKAHSPDIRLITDLRPLNQTLQPQKFKADHWGTVVQCLNSYPQHTWAVTLDLKDFFFHLSLHPQAQRWIRVKTHQGGIQFLGLPFGLQCSPFWAHRLAKPVIQFLRAQGLIICWYVDDILLLAPSQEMCLLQTRFLFQVFTLLGLRLNLTKCQLTPSQQVVYLGQNIDLLQRTVSPIKEKVTAVLKSLRHTVPGKKIRPSVLAALGGTLLDLSKGAVNLIGFPKEIMSLGGKLALQHGWYQTCLKTTQVRILLQNVRESLREICPVQLLPPSSPCLMSVLSTDASDYAWGASLQKPGMKRPLSARQFFSPMERTWHITRKETAALCRGVHSFLEDLPPNSFLKIQTDSVTARAAFQKGSSKPHINQEVRSVRILLAKHKIYSEAVWIPGESNVHADLLSRKLTDRNDYTVPLRLLQQVCQQLDVNPVLDMFAADHNHRFQKYWTWNRSSFAVGQDAFNQDWSQEAQGGTLYANPPWPIIQRFLQKVKIDKSRVLFCLPLWKGQPWWPLLWSMLESRLIVLHHPTFVDRWGVTLPPPRWKVCFGILNGSLSTRVNQFYQAPML